MTETVDIFKRPESNFLAEKVTALTVLNAPLECN